MLQSDISSRYHVSPYNKFFFLFYSSYPTTTDFAEDFFYNNFFNLFQGSENNIANS